MEKQQKKERTIKDYVDILIPKLWLILLVAAVCAAALFTVSFTKKDTYTSSSTYLVFCDSSTSLNSQIYEAQITKNTITKYKSLVEGDSFSETCVRRINDDPACNLNITKSDFTSMFSFSGNTDSQTFTFSITCDDRNTAFNIASTVDECLREEIESLSQSASSIAEIVNISAPHVATGANSKNTLRNTVIAFFVGAILSAVVVLVVAVMDVTIHDKKKIEDNFDIPVIGVIPYQSISNGTDRYTYGGSNEDQV